MVKVFPKKPNLYGPCPKQESCPIDSAERTCTKSRWISYCQGLTTPTTIAQQAAEVGARGTGRICSPNGTMVYTIL